MLDGHAGGGVWSGVLRLARPAGKDVGRCLRAAAPGQCGLVAMQALMVESAPERAAATMQHVWLAALNESAAAVHWALLLITMLQVKLVSPSVFPDPRLPGRPAYDLTHWLTSSPPAPQQPNVSNSLDWQAPATSTPRPSGSTDCAHWHYAMYLKLQHALEKSCRDRRHSCTQLCSILLRARMHVRCPCRPSSPPKPLRVGNMYVWILLSLHPALLVLFVQE